VASEDVVDVLVDVERVAAGLARVLRAIRLQGHGAREGRGG
jgi:hypothetical protein